MSGAGAGPLARAWRAPLALLAVAGVVLIGATCAPSVPRRVEQRVFTDDFELRISSDPSPPRARERVVFRVVVRDKKTREPIENGEGRLFATSADGINAWDILDPAPEPGTYVARLNFITAGDWAMSVQFRRDSLSPLQRPPFDWRQTIHPERP